MTWFGKILTASLVLLAIAAGIAGFVYYQYYEKNIYSKEILKLEILGPREAEAMEEIEYVVQYKNNGNITLEEVRLFFEYPDYSILPEAEQKRMEIPLDDIYPGQEETIRFKVKLLGKQNETREVKALLKYSPKNLQAHYESETTFTTVIKFIPFTFEFDMPSRVETGREFQISLNYFSNIDYPMSDLRVEADYPIGFEFIESEPKPIGQTDWELGLLNKAEGGRIVIKGKMEGELKDKRIFKARLGLWQNGEFIILKEIFKGVELSLPSLYVSQSINGSSDYIASSGDFLHYEVFFKNASEKPFENLFLVVRLESPAFDFDTVRSDLGDFQKGDNSIIWDWKTVPGLRFLGAGEEGKAEFWINIKEEWDFSGDQDKNPVLKNKINLFQAREDLTTKVNSKLLISQKGSFDDSPFVNSGPIPPKVGQKTTYTIFWNVKNFYNDVNNTKVKAILPEGVELTGSILPKEARFTFDSKTREIVWEIGDMEAGQGITNGDVELAFQVELTLAEEQGDQAIILVEGAKISGEDQWTGMTIEALSNTVFFGDTKIGE